MRINLSERAAGCSALQWGLGTGVLLETHSTTGVYLGAPSPCTARVWLAGSKWDTAPFPPSSAHPGAPENGSVPSPQRQVCLIICHLGWLLCCWVHLCSHWLEVSPLFMAGWVLVCTWDKVPAVASWGGEPWESPSPSLQSFGDGLQGAQAWLSTFFHQIGKTDS